MKFIAMFLEIFGEALFALIGFCIICAIVCLIIYSIFAVYHGVNRGGNYVNGLVRRTFNKYSFNLNDKRIFKDSWKNLI